MELSEKAILARRAAKKAWRDKRKEELKVYYKDYRNSHSESMKEYQRRYWEKKALKVSDINA